MGFRTWLVKSSQSEQLQNCALYHIEITLCTDQPIINVYMFALCFAIKMPKIYTTTISSLSLNPQKYIICYVFRIS